ncbi:hypothetical protein J6590_093675, partial [Homalodisca vitripennis]
MPGAGVVWQARLGVDCRLRLKECSDKAVTKGEWDQAISSSQCRLFKIIRLQQPTHYVIWGEDPGLLLHSSWNEWRRISMKTPEILSDVHKLDMHDDQPDQASILLAKQ